MKAINWREKPRKWEVVVMAVVGLLAAGEIIWLTVSLQEQGQAHVAKLQKIEDWTDAMLVTSGRAHSSMVRLEQVDLDVLSLLGPNTSANLLTIKKLSSEWDIKRFRRCLDLLPVVSQDTIPASMFQLFRDQYGTENGSDVGAWTRKLWQLEGGMVKADSGYSDPSYPDFKALLYRKLDPRFSEYFGHDKRSSIALSEILWGGVTRDEIPPLRSPKMISVGEATYLADTDTVFGVDINGDTRAYPKRILAWHELFTDRIGGVDIVGVYCTLCGTMIPYESRTKVGALSFGTSGFLYRSDKLMYDEETKSLWLTLTGEPVVGTQVGRGLKLVSRPVVTTTWGEWKKVHPNTKVLSPDTGYSRDYAEGVAYRDYFASDKLMFPVPELSSILPLKAEVLELSWAKKPATAISTNVLQPNSIYHGRVSSTPFVILTDSSGANRVYRTAVQFKKQAGQAVIGSDGKVWEVAENELRCLKTKETAPRLPAHRAFWFAWHAVYPHGDLIR